MQHELPIYLDNNATTRCDDAVVQAMLPYFTQYFGNAASNSHAFGWSAAEAVKIAREQVAALIGAEPQEIVFTSGATESINLALKGAFEMYATKGNHIITVATEHKAVLDTCAHIERLGGQVTYLPVDNYGLIDLQQLEQAITGNTILIAVMYGNNETGVIQPIKEISAIAHQHNVLFFCDATQAVGKIPVSVMADGIDIMSFSAHKIYGPKGVGALYIRRRNPRVRLAAQIDGGGHERGFRSGTLNVPGIVGFGKACVICSDRLLQDAETLSTMRNRLENELLQLPGVYLNGHPHQRLPNVTNLAFEGIEGNTLLGNLNKEIALSGGSACTSASMEPSHVLQAMGVNEGLAHNSLRFSLGRHNTNEQIDYTISTVAKAVRYLRDGPKACNDVKRNKTIKHS
ncbi:MAG: IscS subfamily cysteine desulfurase [Bacteroidetes bacterium 43-93]|nr:cysteine desulfurase [Bacteroidota bacterium]OJW96153.1 MAG: IscS subfamily cysteine desulfurase [Bacteroidetes bacterium 43-93]